MDIMLQNGFQDLPFQNIQSNESNDIEFDDTDDSSSELSWCNNSESETDV